LNPKIALTDKELSEAQFIIDAAKPGTYTLKKLYGHLWRSKSSPTKFGMGFSFAVVSRQLNGISRLKEKTDENAIQYIVHDQDVAP
jgi:hypothetical protein